MKRIRKYIVLLLCVSLIMSCFVGCSSGGDSIDIIYPFNNDIKSFDPQIASTADEFLVIENCFEGLVRVNDDGSIQAGVAKSWDISDDGRTYTFKLREGAKWNVQSDDKDDLTLAQELMGADFNPDITADDFVFALRRAADKNTNAPLFSTISGIENATKVHSGKMNSAKLGVKAIDSYTLEIKLESADDGFMNTLSTAIAMPCNESYFNATKGRYGLGLKYTIFNGQFYLSSILEASYILRNNKKYVGDYPSKVSDITLKIINEDTDIAKNLKSGYFDAAYITGEEYEQLKDSGITATAYSDKMLGFILNKNSLILSEKELRQAVCLSISDIDLTGIEHLSYANGYIPPSCTIGGKSASEQIGSINTKQNIKKAQELWKKGLEKLGASKASFKVITTEEYEGYVKELVQGIQAGIGQITEYGDERSIVFSLKIEVLSQADYNIAMANGDYDLAFSKFTANTNSPLTYMDNLINGNYVGNVSKANDALEKAQGAKASKLVDATRSCEKALFEDYSIKPVFFESSYYAQAKGVNGVNFHPGSGRVCFVNATREEQ